MTNKNIELTEEEKALIKLLDIKYNKNGNAISEIDTECKMDLNYL